MLRSRAIFYAETSRISVPALFSKTLKLRVNAREPTPLSTYASDFY